MAFRRLHHVIKHLRSTATAAFTTDRPSRRRYSPAARAAALGVGRFAVEPLETRALLTTISGFTDDVFEYRDELDQVIRVKATGNIVAELIGAQIDRRTNDITLVNLPGNLNGQEVFGGLLPDDAIDPIGPVFLPNGIGTIQAVAGTPDGELYAFNSFFQLGQTVHQLIRLTPLPVPAVLGAVDGDVIGEVVSTFTLPSNLAVLQAITAADALPNGRLVFVARTTDEDIGLFSIDPSVQDAAPAPEGRLDVRPGDDDDPLPNVTSIAAINDSRLIAVVNGENGFAESQLLEINLQNPTVSPDPIPLALNAIGGAAIPNIVGLEVDEQTGELIGVQAGLDPDDDANVYQIFTNGVAFNLGPVGTTNLTSLAFLPGYQDPFSGRTTGSYVALTGNGTLVNVDVRDRLPAQFLYHVYVAQSDLTGQLTMGWVAPLFEPPPVPTVIRAFEESIGNLRVRSAQGGASILVSADPNTGRMLFGARSQDITPATDLEQLIPYDTAELPTDIDFGTLPDNLSALRPGLVVEEGQDLGKFMVGGTFMGAVDARGSIDFFYAGWLLTGSARGQVQGPPERPDNFNVAGDLRTLTVLDSIGTDGEGVATNSPQYVTGFDLRVGGTVGEVSTGAGAAAPVDDPDADLVASASAFIGSAEVNHLPNAPRIERNQFESEFHIVDPILALTDGFEEFNFTGASGAPNVTFNDAYNTPEYLGSIASSALGRAEVVRLSGSLQQSPLFEDPADYYAVGLMAGRRYTVRVQGVPPGLINLGVFDPDGRLIATDYNNTNLELTQEQFFSFVPDRPGIFRFAIAATGDAPDFSGTVTTNTDIGYTFTLLGMGDVALGGLVADGAIVDLFDPLSYDPGVEVFVGDVGAVKSYGSVFLSDNPNTLVVERGSLRTVDAANIGLAAALFAPPVSTPTIDVPQGDVGLIRAGTFVVPFDQHPLARVAEEPLIAPSQTLGFNIGNTRPIGGTFQVIDGDEANVIVDLFADGGIGVIRAADMSAGASVLTVNADDTGEDGIIDLIDCFGDLGNIATGGPQITTNTGGNVRYMRVLGTVYKDVFFGVGEPDQIILSPGTETTVVDDSGSVLRMRAIGEVRRNPAFNPAFPQSGIPEFIGPTTTITPFGIRDAGGSVLIDVTSEGGLDVEVSNAAGGSAEIGRIEIRGAGVEVLNGPDVDDPESPLGTRENFVTAIGTIVPTPDEPVDPDEEDGDPDFEPTDRRIRPEDLSIFIRGNGTVDVLNVVVIDTADDNDADEDGEPDTADEDNDGDTTELADADGDGFPDSPGNDNEIRQADGFYLGEIRETLNELLSFGNAVNIVNDTPRGEIVNLLAESVVNLQANGSIGMGRNSWGADIVGNEILHMASDLRGIPGVGRRTREVQTGNVRDVGQFGYFLGETNGIMALGGNISSIRAGEAIGNIAVQGSVGEVIANADERDVPGLFEGINGVVSTYGFEGIDQPVESGRIFRVNIGEGVLPTGTGNFAEAGIFGYNSVGRVVGNNADIRGDIQALNKIIVIDLQQVETEREQAVGGGEATIVRPRGIETVRIDNGSIINSDIIITTNREDVEEFDAGFAIPAIVDPINAPIYEIGSITTSGNGGIIGSNFQASDIGRVAAGGGTFGIFETLIGGLADDRVNSVEASGYGLRGLFIDPSGSLGSLVANGDGTSLSTNALSSSVRLSETPATDPLVGFIDPFFGTQPNRLTDIHAQLGTSREQPELSGVTDTGVIERTTAIGSRDLGRVSAWQIRGGTNLDFANSIGTLQVRDIINGLEVTTGTLRNFRLDRDAFALGINVTGRVRKVDIRGSLAGGSVIRTKGEGGSFDSVNVSGNLIGNINSSRAIKNITIGGDFTGNVSVQSGGTAIKSMKVGGSFIAGSLDVLGGINTLQTKGSLGTLGDTLTINGSVKKIMVGGDLRSNLRVTGSLKQLNVRGSIVDGGLPNGLLIDVSDTLASLVVGGDIQSGVTINAARIGKQKVGGQNAATIVIQ